jgi:hypothetical protein
MVTGKGMPMMMPDPPADLAAALKKLLIGDVNDFWYEATHGAVSFEFDVYDKFVTLPNDWETWYRRSQPRTIDAQGATFPITWTNGETLELMGDNGFRVTVTFQAATQTLSDIVTEINNAVEAAWAKPKQEVPFLASQNSGQLRLQTTAQNSKTKLDVTGGSARTKLGMDSPSITAGVDAVSKPTQMAEESLKIRTQGMSESERESFLKKYDGLIITMPVKSTTAYYRAHATLDPTQLDINGTKHTLDIFWITNEYPWELVAHEIGQRNSCDQCRVELSAGQRDYAICQLLYTYGVRGGQVRALRYEDIDWVHNQILFRGAVGMSGRADLRVSQCSGTNICKRCCATFCKTRLDQAWQLQ